MKNHNFSFRLVFIVLMLALAVSACTTQGSSFKSTVLNPVKAAPEINLPDQNGRPFQLSAMRGKAVAVFFGYTNCPDECPLTLAHLKEMLGQMGEDAQRVQVVLVSTDPVRDTPPVMQTYLKQFGPTFVGIAGAVDDLAKIWGDYGVVVEDGGETHSSSIFIVDPNGKLRLKMNTETTPETMAADFKQLLAAQ